MALAWRCLSSTVNSAVFTNGIKLLILKGSGGLKADFAPGPIQQAAALQKVIPLVAGLSSRRLGGALK